MKREPKPRPPTLEDIGRELVKGESLEVQLAMSTFIARAKEAAKQNQQLDAAEGVIDFERGWIIK